MRSIGTHKGDLVCIEQVFQRNTNGDLLSSEQWAKGSYGDGWVNKMRASKALAHRHRCAYVYMWQLYEFLLWGHSLVHPDPRTCAGEQWQLAPTPKIRGQITGSLPRLTTRQLTWPFLKKCACKRDLHIWYRRYQMWPAGESIPGVNWHPLKLSCDTKKCRNRRNRYFLVALC